MPAHLGWGSAPTTAAIRGALASQAQARAQQEAHNLDWLQQPELPIVITTLNQKKDHPNHNEAVKLYPDIALGMLRQEQAAAGRIWLLLKHIDCDGCGWVFVNEAREQLARKNSKLRVCGWRQLRNLLKQGEGIFWRRGKERIWLKSAAKVAAALGVPRLTGRPVALPLQVLLGGIGDVRAHFYASFHSGRTKETEHGPRGMPIARDTMTQLSGVGRRSQRTYEQRAGVKAQANFAVGEVANEENRQNRAWTQGPALFELVDYRGRQGKKGRAYLAWQLANSYVGKHPHQPKGRQKRINRELRDLVTEGMPGNVERTIEKRYYPNGKLAAMACSRNPEQERYWRCHRTKNGRFEVWQKLGGKQCK